MAIGCAFLLVGVGVGIGYLAGQRPAGADHHHESPSEADHHHEPHSREVMSPPSVTRDQRSAASGGEREGAASAAPEVVPDGAGEASESPSAEAVRDLEVARLKQSGADARNLVADAKRVSTEWSGLARAAGIKVSFGDWQCFRAGCFVNLRHAPAAIDRLTSEITTSRGFLDWNGEKMRSGPIEAVNGNTEVTWILAAPPEGEDAIAVVNERGN